MQDDPRRPIFGCLCGCHTKTSQYRPTGHLNYRPSLAVLTLTVKLWDSKHTSLAENVLVCGVVYVVLEVPECVLFNMTA
ncbi:uncharacterized protein LOC113460896 isoform X10 [Zonotrichia albicollis]|uniref:uncharacterized protein LOC113460896 isoform X10 n=1 Tax=Zonotrichia albicollis TaxID=44394 RepID=UPI003D80F469